MQQRTAPIHVHPPGLQLALVGNPNCGKTALFNRLTGSRQKVANYAGVTVERKEGRIKTHAGRQGACACWTCRAPTACYPRSPDERVTCDVLFGRAVGEKSSPTWWCAWSTPPTCGATCAWCWP